jgi:benzoyl-CoA reductase/2-hydroxyglutaryl-CoA dehydratase subunit BcrC/BadD/HgdB
MKLFERSKGRSKSGSKGKSNRKVRSKGKSGAKGMIFDAKASSTALPSPLDAIPEKRYVSGRDDFRSESQEKKIIDEAENRISAELEKLKATKNRPKSMDYFDNIAKFYGPRIKEIKKFKEGGGKVIGTFCSFVPNEIIAASGSLPLRLDCGFHEFIKPANDLLGGAGLCPLVRSTIGSKILMASPYMELCDLIISPTPCDAKLKMAEMLQDFGPVHIMNVPRAKDKEFVRKQWTEEVFNMKRTLETFTGNTITVKGLKSAIRSYQEAEFAWRKLVALRKEGNVLWGRDALLVAWLSYLDDIGRWTKKVEKLSQELEGMLKNKVEVVDSDAPRIMLAGSPIMWPNWKLPNIIEELGAIVVTDELCSGTRAMYDPVVVDEWTEKSMMNAIADRYLFPCTCPCFTPNLEREENMLNRIKEYEVEGVIFHILKGCHLNSFDAAKTSKFLKDNDMLVLKIESEYDVGDIGQIRVRVEAFLEMINAEKGFIV